METFMHGSVRGLGCNALAYSATVCGKTARTDLWGSGEETNRSTRNFFVDDLSKIHNFIGEMKLKIS
jgi:hypothetical protein